MKSLIYPFKLSLLALTLSAPTLAQNSVNTKGLKDYYAAYFPIGVAVSPGLLKDQRQSELVLKEFNSLTPENAMKMGSLHPEENRYDWRQADAIVDYATAHHMRVRGHNLCWHEQVPKWMFVDSNGNTVGKELLLKRLKEHIFTVVKRYKGRIYAWDVVNEAVDDDPANLLRNSMWYKICGEDFIAQAFIYAHEADPDAILFYNDYNTERPEKRDRVYRLLKKLIAAKVPINGVGLQAHWSIYEPSKSELTDAVKLFSSLGLKIQVTELDISIYPWEKEARAKRPDESDLYTSEAKARQNTQYQMVFDVFRQYRKSITGITFWNLSDQYSWLDYYPVRGRKNYPLLFDQTLKPKEAYWKVTQF